MRREFSNRLIDIMSMLTNTDDNMFKIEELIYNNTLMFYYSEPKYGIYSIITTNRYIRPSDIRNYISGVTYNTKIFTTSKLLAVIICDKLEWLYHIPKFLNTNLTTKNLNLTGLYIDNFDIINKVEKLEEVKIRLCSRTYVSNINLPNV